MTLSSSLLKCSKCGAHVEVISVFEGVAFIACPQCTKGHERGQVPITYLINALMRDVRGLQYLADNAPKNLTEPLTFEDVKQELISLLKAKEVDYDYYD